MQLSDGTVWLEPVRRSHWRDVAAVPEDPAFDLLIRRFAGGPATARRWTREACVAARTGAEHTWLIRRVSDDVLVGSTRLLNIDLANRRVEIGATWLTHQARGTSANAESKLLLLACAFDVLHVDRVHIQCDARNTRSQRAILALGATHEGTLRRHLVLPDGTSRDTVVYSILRTEWPQVRAGLEARIVRKRLATVTDPFHACHEVGRVSA